MIITNLRKRFFKLVGSIVINMKMTKFKKKEHNKHSQFSVQSVFFNCDSLHARLNSHYEAMEIQEKEVQKDYSIQEIYLERTYS